MWSFLVGLWKSFVAWLRRKQEPELQSEVTPMPNPIPPVTPPTEHGTKYAVLVGINKYVALSGSDPVSYTHLRAHET